MKRRPRILISGGGTGGHIFPALSIADACRRRWDADILFVGAEGRMEMERVPAAGYTIKALPVAGFDRHNLLKNFSVLKKLRKSLKLAKGIIKEFKPDIAIGVGGYASGPTLKAAQRMGIPTLLQEQNSYAGVTNKLLSRKAKAICVAYDGMERFFPAGKIVATGNPVRKDLTATTLSPAEARKKLGLEPDKPTLLVVGGSLGALTINEAMEKAVKELSERGIQVIWQTGKRFGDRATKAAEQLAGVIATPFITDMACAYAAASLVVSRAGAGTISELELLGKPAILVPSPNVAEDHQTKNARALSTKGAAVLIPDSEARERLEPEILALISSPEKLAEMSQAISRMAFTDSDEKIADEIEKILDIRKRYFFIGAGGIGMANLVRYFLSKGYRVGGYDRVRSELTRRLESEGAEIIYEDELTLIPAEFLDREKTEVVYTPAIPADNHIFTYFRQEGYEMHKRAWVLGEITRNMKGICVAGSHGKTTTSSMAAWILNQTPDGCDAFLGGILRNVDSNLIMSPRAQYAVVEADEYDRSFHQLSPWIAVITSADPDHLDIYGDEAHYLEAFSVFTSLIRPGGALLLHTGLQVKPDLKEGVRLFTYSGPTESTDAPEADWRAENVEYGEGELYFDLVGPEGVRVSHISLGVPVEINIDNAVAAGAAAWLAGATEEEIRKGLETFKGAKRRFEILLRGEKDGARTVLIDDYAHSPAEIEASIKSIRKLYPGKRITVAFQPHLYTRTRDFAPEFAEALSHADHTILTEIYPARELPIEGVTSEIILRRMTSNSELIERKDLLDKIKITNFDILITLGAADLDVLLPEIAEILRRDVETGA